MTIFLFSQIIRISLEEFFVYRLNFILWRFRSLINLVIKYYLWLAVYEGTPLLFGYTEGKMLTYILLSSLISSFVLSTRTGDIAGQILNGDVINSLLRPLSFFGYHAARDVSDRLLNFIFSIGEVLLLYVLLKPQIYINTNPVDYAWVAVFILFGAIISFNINMLLSFIAFWSPEVWAPRFIFFMLLIFLSGGFFPLDILPDTIYKALLLTPFPYFYFIPTKIYLGYRGAELFGYFLSALGWAFVTSYIVKTVWKKGLREFSFFGR